MLRSTRELRQYAIAASDGVFAHVRDFYFDDESWVVRYLAIDTGEPHATRRVLMSPLAIEHTDWSQRLFKVALTQEEVRRSADVKPRGPVSRRHEQGYFDADARGRHWGGGGPWGAGFHPDMLQTVPGVKALQEVPDDPHLRSAEAVSRYQVGALDGEMGQVHDFLVDDHSWAIRYLVVNTSRWWFGHEVIIAPEWIDDVDWTRCTVAVDLGRQAVKDAPAYQSERPLDHEHELCTHRHYGRDGYWPRAAAPGASPPAP